MHIQAIKEAISKLSRVEQAELMHFMIELLAKDDFQLSEAWIEELSRREGGLDKGESAGKPAREVQDTMSSSSPKPNKNSKRPTF